MRRIVSTILILVMVAVLCVPANAYGKKDHNALIESIIFGSSSNDLTEAMRAKLALLEAATTICLDQYQGSYTDELEALNKEKIHGIPKSIDSINFTSNQYHRRYTHRGWDFSYTPPASLDKANWPVRKDILLQTVNHVFDFQNRSGKWQFLWIEKDYGYTEQCNSFAAFLYYLHILGEYKEAAEEMQENDGKTTHFNTSVGQIVPLAVAHPGKGNVDVFSELELHFPVIFATQKKAGSNTYLGMMNDIQMLASGARSMAAERGGITKDNFQEYCQYAMDLIGILESTIPGLLQEESFFAAVF